MSDVTIAYEDAQDIRLTDTLDFEGIPGEAEIVQNLEDQTSESGWGSDSGTETRSARRSRRSKACSQVRPIWSDFEL